MRDEGQVRIEDDSKDLDFGDEREGPVEFRQWVVGVVNEVSGRGRITDGFVRLG